MENYFFLNILIPNILQTYLKSNHAELELESVKQKIFDKIIDKIKVHNLIELLVDNPSFGEIQSMLLKI